MTTRLPHPNFPHLYPALSAGIDLLTIEAFSLWPSGVARQLVADLLRVF